MKTRLLAYGCSNTFGEGLDDIWRPGDGSVRYGINLGEPSRFAWPRELGRLMKFDRVHNLAEGGASNKKIWRNILQTEIAKQLLKKKVQLEYLQLFYLY